jgi:hypothetical protein
METLKETTENSVKKFYNPAEMRSADSYLQNARSDVTVTPSFSVH